MNLDLQRVRPEDEQWTKGTATCCCCGDSGERNERQFRCANRCTG